MSVSRLVETDGEARGKLSLLGCAGIFPVMPPPVQTVRPEAG